MRNPRAMGDSSFVGAHDIFSVLYQLSYLAWARELLAQREG
jgi:hypothetical protein